jgi:drug/metabolite transporter (DMT)-like permease
MWLWFAVLSGLFYTISGLINRQILKGKQDAWAFSFYFSAVGTLITFPFLIFHPKYATTISPWLIMIIVGFLIVVQNLLIFKSSNVLEASIQGAMTKFRLVWVLIIGLLFLKESFSLYKLFGTLLTVAGGVIIVTKFNKIPSSFKGLGFIFSSTIIYAIVIGLYKLLLIDFNSQSLTFFIFLLPTIINLCIMPNAFNRIVSLYKVNGKAVILTCALGGFANLVMNQALSLGEASKVLVIIEAFLILTLMGEHLVLKERQNFMVKIFAVLLATVGAIFIRLS